MEKFTKGPWVVQNGSDVFTQLGAMNNSWVYAASNDGWHIADCAHGVTFDTDGLERTLVWQEIAANAQLIAQAPVMYAALKELCDSCMGECDDCEVAGILKAARGES